MIEEVRVRPGSAVLMTEETRFALLRRMAARGECNFFPVHSLRPDGSLDAFEGALCPACGVFAYHIFIWIVDGDAHPIPSKHCKICSQNLAYALDYDWRKDFGVG